MVDAAANVPNGIEIDGSVLRLYPSADGMQHDERKTGFPILTPLLGLSWREKRRSISDPKTTLHDSVYERFKLPSVVQYDSVGPYRPETLRCHVHLTGYYRDVPERAEARGLRAFRT